MFKLTDTDMQPSYGFPQIHPHFQQHQVIMDADCCPLGFSISNSNPNNTHNSNNNNNNQNQIHQRQQIFLPQRQQPEHNPITHQLFHRQEQQYQLFHHQQHQNESLRHEPRLEHVNGGGCGGGGGDGGRVHVQAQNPNISFNVNFKLGLNESSGGSREGIFNQQQSSNSSNTFLHGNDQNVTQSLSHSHVMHQPWNSIEDSSKEPFWKLLQRDVINGGNVHPNEDKEHGRERERICEKQLQELDGGGARIKDLESKYRHFGELEAIYNRGKIGEGNNQTGSGSALTCANSPPVVSFSVPNSDVHCQNMDATTCAGVAPLGVDHGSEASIGEGPSPRKIQRRKRKRKQKEKLMAMAGIFESLVKQVMDHQDCLHAKFLEVIERIDKERIHREELWRNQESTKFKKEAIARAHEQALTSNRDALIVSYLEKITGQSINLPSRGETPLLVKPEVIINEFEALNQRSPSLNDTNSRWPKAEVEALIQARSSLEYRFQEPGLKGPLWEEVSSLMASMGYQRNSKRCKEKWENINKYFKKTKESGLKRSPNSRTCPYFDKLDELYSRTPIISPTSTTLMSLINNGVEEQRQGCYPELLHGFTNRRELGNADSPSDGIFKTPELGSSKLDFDGVVLEEVENGSSTKETGNQQYLNGIEEDDSSDHSD